MATDYWTLDAPKKRKREEAQRELAQIYGWFTEGFDTPDLTEAEALLQKLSQKVAG